MLTCIPSARDACKYDYSILSTMLSVASTHTMLDTSYGFMLRATRSAAAQSTSLRLRCGCSEHAMQAIGIRCLQY
jgi:hypothetical protein